MASDADRWFYWKTTIPTIKNGLLDLLDVCLIEGSQAARGGPLTYIIYLRCLPNHPVTLDEPNFLVFDAAWKKLWLQ